MEQTLEAQVGLAQVKGRKALVLLDNWVTQAMPLAKMELISAGAVVEEVDFGRLEDHLPHLHQLCERHHIDFVLFSTNDQVGHRHSIGHVIRELGVGYSTISAIDDDALFSQTQACLRDYLYGGEIAMPDPKTITPQPTDNVQGTFSLIFDLEQLGGARFGLPRVLDRLAIYNAPATFFTTSFVPAVYSNALDLLHTAGHEVGLHGRTHEYLAGRCADSQADQIGQMLTDFSSVSVQGANFVIRMDNNTVHAMIANQLRYFVTFAVHHYRPMSYRKMSVKPQRVWSPNGSIWMLPVSVETYNRPWLAIRGAIRSAIHTGKRTNHRHVNILMHPFRDGSAKNIGVVERILKLMQRQGYRPVTLAQHAASLPTPDPTCLINYSVPEQFGQFAGSGDAWWIHADRYQQRVAALSDRLLERGQQPALTLSADFATDKPCYSIFPHLSTNIAQRIQHDPLTISAEQLPTAHNGQFAFVPPTQPNRRRNLIQSFTPDCPADITSLFPELGMRLAYRLQPDKHIF